MSINKKIAVVGSNGFIGSNLVDYLSKHYQVIAFSSKPLGFKTNQKVKYINSKNLNINNIKNLKSLKCNKFIYCVSMNHVDTAKDVKKTLDVNVKKFIEFCEILKKVNKKNTVMYLSTFQVYGDLTDKKIINEKTPVKNENLYALTHSFCEEYLKLQNNKNFIGINLRLSNVFGYPLSKKSNAWWLVLNSFCKKIIEQGELVISSDGKSFRDFIYIDDFNRIILKILKNINRAPNLINISSGNCISIKEAANQIKKVCEQKLKKKCEIKILNKSVTTKNNKYFKVKISKFIRLKNNKNFSKNIELFLKKIILLKG